MVTQQKASGVQCAIDELTSVPADLFEEFMRAGAKVRAGGQHRLVKNSRGEMRLMHASVVVSPQRIAVQDLKPDGPSSFLKTARRTSTPDVFSSVLRQFRKDSPPSHMQVAHRASNPDEVCVAKQLSQAVLVSTISDATLGVPGGPRLERGGSLVVCSC